MAWQNKILNETELKKIEELVQKFEDKTGAELKICIFKISDTYPAATFRFAIFFTFFLSCLSTLIFSFSHPIYCLVLQLPIFLISCAFGRLTLFKKFFLAKREIKREVREKALEIFDQEGVRKTTDHVGILVFISIIERKIELVTDQTIFSKLGQESLDHLVANLGQHLKSKKYAQGIEDIVRVMEEKLLHFFPNKLQDKVQNEVPNQITWGNIK